MTDRYRDDYPTAFILSRRKVLVGGLLLAGSVAAMAALPALCTQVPLSDEFAAQFMGISSRLIPHRLDGHIGKRIAAAMLARDPALRDHVTALLAIANKKNTRVVEDFFPDVPDGPVKEAALAIISAWYLGVVVDEPGAEVIAYEHALMYQPTRDVMTIPSYARSRPNGWNADAAALSDMPSF
ncbi:sugar dehydrogenase complex small subunit [Paraburkholderia sp. EG286B]|uniref:sugar dehydrogenase complex small subunit n=1 Tax=Paraburkholderia sp. EG286B TaxID=3237011 RepID=UPI0034D315C4